MNRGVLRYYIGRSSSGAGLLSNPVLVAQCTSDRATPITSRFSEAGLSNSVRWRLVS